MGGASFLIGGGEEGVPGVEEGVLTLQNVYIKHIHFQMYIYLSKSTIGTYELLSKQVLSYKSSKSKQFVFSGSK